MASNKTTNKKTKKSGDQPVLPTEEDPVDSHSDLLPQFRQSVADIQAQSRAVVAAVRAQARNAKRARSPSSDDDDGDYGEDSEDDSVSEHEYTDDVEKRLASIAERPFDVDTAIRHADALVTVAHRMGDALRAEKKQRRITLRSIDEWAAEKADGFDIRKPAHAAALRWFTENLAFERSAEEWLFDSWHQTVISVSIGDCVRVVGFSGAHDMEEVEEEWSKVASTKYPPPPRRSRYMGFWEMDDSPSKRSKAKPQPTPVDLSSKAADRKAVMALLPATCPLKDIPSPAVVALLKVVAAV